MAEPTERRPDDVCALERLLARRRTLASQLLSLDAYDRWGARTAEDRARVAEETRELEAERVEVIAELEALVEGLRRERPAAVREWALAHIELLEHYVESLGADAEDKLSTERFVAEQEADKWGQVRDGTLPYVEENVFYVHLDPTLYRQLFGFEPR
jgi:hypothetical protein